MKIVKLFILLFLSMNVYTQIIVCDSIYTTHVNIITKQADRIYEDTTGFYVIHFEYNWTIYYLPINNPVKYHHYEAVVTVYKVLEGKRKIIGRSFQGMYTVEGCVEDNSKYLVEKAKSM